MISRVSFFKLLKEDIKKRGWIFLLFLIVCTVAVPIMLSIEIDAEAAFYGKNSKELKQWYQGVMCDSGLKMFLIITSGAIVSAVTSFWHLHSRKQTDFYLGFPVRREIWFAVTSFGSALQILLPFTAGYILQLAVGIIKGVASPKVFQQSLAVLLTHILFFTLIYEVTAVGMIITGKILVAMLAVFALMFWAPGIVSLKAYILMQAFDTYLVKDETSGFLYNLYGKGAPFSPVLGYLKAAALYRNDGNIQKSLFYVVLAILLVGAAALALYKIRPAEAAGKGIAFPALEPVIKVAGSVSVGVFLAVTVSSQNHVKGTMSAGWMYFVGILTVLIVCGIVEFICTSDIRMIFRRKISAAISLGIVLVFCSVIRFDLTGFDAWLPEKSEIAAMSLESYALGSMDSFGLFWNGRDVTENLKRMETGQFDSLYELAREGVNYAGQSHTGTEKEQEKHEVAVAYYLKNGKTVYRSYYADTNRVLQCMDEMLQDETGREKYFSLDAVSRKKYNAASFEDGWGGDGIFISAREELAELKNLYIEEVKKQPLSTFMDGHVAGNLYFYKGDVDSDCFPVYQEMTAVLDFVKEYGEIETGLHPEDIVSMKVQHFVGQNDGDIEEIISVIEPEERKELAESLCFREITFLKPLTVPDVYVEVEMKNGWFTYYIKNGCMPEFLAERINSSM